MVQTDVQKNDVCSKKGERETGMLIGIERTDVVSSKRRVTELDVEESLCACAIKKGESESGMLAGIDTMEMSSKKGGTCDNDADQRPEE